MQTTSSIFDAILSLDTARALGKSVPYSYVLGADTQKIFVFGIKHSRSPDDLQFTLLKELWTQFTALSSNKIVFVEDFLPSVSQSFEDAVQRDDMGKRSGEGGAITWLARRDGAEVILADLTPDERTKSLVDHFGAAKVAYYNIAYTMWNYARGNSPAQLDKVIEGNRSTFEPFGLTLNREWFDAEHEQLFRGQQPDDAFWKELWKNVKAVGSPASFMREITSESARVRNIKAIGLFQQYWDKGYSIFAVYGANHSWEWEPALRKLIGEN